MIWRAYEASEWFSYDERVAIDRYMLPTYLEDPGETGRWVRKPIFGREGEGIAIFADGNPVARSARRGAYEDQPMVWQAYVPPPRVSFARCDGEVAEGYAVATCFVVDGAPSAIGMRIGAEITDSRTHFQPLGLVEGAEDELGSYRFK